jgi:imidazoleglycerol phosphate dehydratase HisB
MFQQFDPSAADVTIGQGSGQQATVQADHRLPASDGHQLGPGGWTVDLVNNMAASVRRQTAETVVAIAVKVGAPSVACDIVVSESVDVRGAADLLTEFARGAKMQLEVRFRATQLSSSHVVMEDIGIALGRALALVAANRMSTIGIEGAGSNVDVEGDLRTLPVRAGISIEGRKFWKFVPFQQTYDQFRRTFLIGHIVGKGLYSEDLDDFVDGLAGGLNGSLMIHLAEPIDPAVGWPLIFRALGEAMAEALMVNPSRRGLIPGVKATLA